MTSTKATVTQAEIRRCLKAAREAGLADCRVEIQKPDGTKLSVSGKTSDAEAATDDFDAMIGRLP